MSLDEFKEYVSNSTAGAKTKTRNKSAKKKPDSMTAGEFRDQYVDQIEHGLQARCLEWFHLAYPQLLMFAVPNAADRSPVLAAMMKDEGLTAGIPDLFLAYPQKKGERLPGLFIEMKTVNGKPSDAQLVIHAYLRAVGYAVIMPTTFEEFKLLVDTYLV